MGSEDSNNPKFVRLKKIFAYEETTRAWIEFDGKCGYCGQDLIEDRLHYSCGGSLGWRSGTRAGTVHRH